MAMKVATGFRLPTTGGYTVTSVHNELLADRKFHMGIDLALTGKNAPVVATGAGEVAVAGWVNGYGWVVLLNHQLPDGSWVSSWVAHLAGIDSRIKAGATVDIGQILGSEGSTGNSTGEHVHFGMAFGRLGSVPVGHAVTSDTDGNAGGFLDPLSFLAAHPAFSLGNGADTATLTFGGTYSALGGHDIITGSAHADKVFAGTGNDLVLGMNGADVLLGEAGNDRLVGGQGKDTLDGGDGADIVWGGEARDVLRGGAGADVFLYTEATDSRAGKSNRDVIVDFGSNDVIDLSMIDASTRASGNQAFTFIGDRDFSGKAGQIRFEDGVLEMDRNGDRAADMEVAVTLVGITKLDDDDFIL